MLQLLQLPSSEGKKKSGLLRSDKIMNHQKQIWVVAGLVSYLSTGSHSPVKLDAPPAESVLSPYFHNLEMYTHTHTHVHSQTLSEQAHLKL